MNGSALAVGDRARFRLPDKSVHRGVVTAINGDGTYSLEEEGTGAAHRLPGAKVKFDDTPTVVRLITQDENETGEDGEALLRVEQEGLQLLESLNETRVAVCSVAGMYRTGKSFFLNRLAGSAGGFGVGETTEPCTRGVWLWHRPDLKTSDGATLLLMDTEGLASADQDETYDAKVFALALLLSSYFVLNVVGVIDDSTIERLHLVTEVTKRIVTDGPE